MKTVAIIPAGGTGRRMAAVVPKQYLLLGGLPIFVQTLRVFQASSHIDEIVLVVPAPDVPSVLEMVERQYHLTKVSRVLAGGKERQDSVRNGLRSVGEEHDLVVIHDAVRPFVSGELIRRIVEGAMMWRAVAAGLPARDTLKKVTPDEMVEETLDRDRIWLVQTPQAFDRQLIERAYEQAYADRFVGTDDASLVERTGVKVRMIRGSSENIKITTHEDLLMGESLMKKTRA